MSSPPWVYDVRPLADLVQDVADLRLLIVGGGHLVRFDKDVAPGYEPTSAEVHHPTGYWLTPTLLAAAAGIPVAWNAVGASADTPPWARPLLAAAMDAADYVSARDGGSLAELGSVASSDRVTLVPDPAFGVGPLLAADRERGTTLRREHGLEGPYVIIQPSTRLQHAGGLLRAAADAARKAGRTVVELPISPALGDTPGLVDLGPGTVSINRWPDPVAIGLLAAGAEAVLAHSLHLSIVALASGVPVLRLGAPADSKYEQLARFSGVRILGAETDELPELLAVASPGAPAPDVVEQASQLTRHWDAIAGLVTGDDDAARARRRQAVSRLIVRLPGLHEDLARDADGVAAQSAAAFSAEVARAQDDVARLQTARAEAERRMDDLGRQQEEARSRRDAAEASIVALSDELAEARRQIVQLQAAGTETERRTEGVRRQLHEELALRDAKLIEANSTVDRLKRDLAEASRRIGALRRRRAVRVVLRLSAAVRRARRLFAARPSAGPSGKGMAQGVDASTSPREATVAEEAAFVERLRAQLPPSTRRAGPMVSIIIPTRNGLAHLRRLLPALESTTYRDFEVVVIDNASTDQTQEYLASFAQSIPLRTIENETNRTFSEACNQGLERAAGTLVLLLNDDVEPLSPGWLGRLVTTLEESNATAVGARLIYPRRPALDNAGDRQFRDLTLQHRGIGFVPEDGVPVARNLGTGDDPLAPVAMGTREVAGLTAACMLVDREALQRVGGLTEGYVYGTEDVDLALKLRAAGGRLVYDGGAVLWHHEYGTQNQEGAEWKRANRRANRQLFVDRWGPQVFREVMLDRLEHAGRWSEQPFHVGITLTRDDPAAGWGDYYTAKELGGALEALGWRASYLERHGDGWAEADPSIDVVISLLDGFDLRRLPRHVVTVAWIRNWTHRWLSHPWFDDYDIVFASSAESRRLVAERSAHLARPLPLATNPERFTPLPPDPGLAADVMFAGNYWGQPRDIFETLGELHGDLSIKIFGKGWSETPLAIHDQGELPYDRLPRAYASAGIVIDDTAGPTKPYGAVNARVFDALASGSMVVTDNEGVRELFDDEFPVARDGAQLARIIDELRSDPPRARALAERYRATVLAGHTYAHRAREVRDALLEWVRSQRVSILIGAPDREQALSWGDHHFAHSLQRQLQQSGLPTRVEVLPDWERASTARQDVVIHLFGLREYRSRPSQINLLWVISHPDLVRPAACERYDHVFVASDTFAAQLDDQVGVPVTPLHQATDPARFWPDPVGPAHDLLFVGNSRNTQRKVITDLGDTSLDLAIYGRNWTPELVDMSFVKGEYVPNEILHRYYSSARIVLNDQWEDMRANGFIANRLYDALACGAFCISEEVPGLDAEFDGAVVTYSTADELHARIAEYLDAGEARRALGERGRVAVLGRHTFEHRAAALLAAIDGLRRRHPMRVADLQAHERWLRRRTDRQSGVKPGSDGPAPGDDGPGTESADMTESWSAAAQIGA